MSKNINRFADYNSWRVVNVGKTEIVLNDDDTISHIRRGRMFKMSSAAEEYVAKNAKLANAVREFVLARRQAARDWKHSTSHYRYTCDGGALAVMVNGVKFNVGNRYGDGDHPVYIIRDRNVAASEPPEFEPTGLSIDGPARLDVLDYDGVNGKILETIELVAGKSAWFKIGHSGSVIIESC